MIKSDRALNRGVQEICLELIKRGDETCLGEMEEALERYGDKALAEDFLNCNQPDLEAASLHWANQRGMVRHTGQGSSRASWAQTLQ